MAFRLSLVHQGKTLFFGLSEGDNLVGSRSDCPVFIEHPTVSRCHANVSVSDPEVTVADQGSSNGTRVDGRLINEITLLEPGATLQFGSVRMLLEFIDDAEMVAWDGSPEPITAIQDQPGETPDKPTSTPIDLDDFIKRHLEALIDNVRQECSLTVQAGRICEALLTSLPLEAIEISDRRGNSPVLLFSSGRPDQQSAAFASIQKAGFELRFESTAGHHGRGYRPMLTSLLGLLALSRPEQDETYQTPELPPQSALKMPEPVSLSPHIREIYSQAARLASSKVSFLITGATGTGKEVLAAYVHAGSEVSGRDWVALNCAALPEDLLELELFGIEDAVATGVSAREGCFELAHGGTLFLDEIGDMSPRTQAKILRVLQEKTTYRIGGKSPRPASARIIAATNQDLAELVRLGEFRSDLYYRLADFQVQLPTLQQRQCDIPQLANHFLNEFRSQGTTRARGISKAAMDHLCDYDWPGNIRQLQKEIQRLALLVGDDELIQSALLNPEIRRATPHDASSLDAIVAVAERDAIEQTLSALGGDIDKACETLAISKSTLYRRMRQLGIERT